jgi:voltage-gated potassium channel
MRWEGQQHSWLAGVYWTLVVMSTLGFGDITFTSDLGATLLDRRAADGNGVHADSVALHVHSVLLCSLDGSAGRGPGAAQAAKDTRGHVVLTGLGPVDAALIRQLQRAEMPYVIVCADLTEALLLHDQGYRVMLGDLDDPETYRRLQVDKAEWSPRRAPT